MIEDIAQILHENGLFYLSTTDGQAGRVRPFGFVMVYEGKLYFTTSKQKELYQQLGAYPHCEICSCNAQGQFTRVRGKAVFDERKEVKTKVFEAMPDLLGLYQGGVDNPDMTTFYLEAPSAVRMNLQGKSEKINV